MNQANLPEMLHLPVINPEIVAFYFKKA